MIARILVVDDDPAIRALLARFVALEGYTPQLAANGYDALASVEQDPPDLVLLDVHMPGMDGFEVCRRLKANPQTALIPVTMLTAVYDGEHRRLGLEAGADDFLFKPIDQALLRARIRSQLNIKQLTDQLEHTENVIFMLATAVELKDAYTQGHLLRMEQFSEQLARQIGLSEEEVRWIRYGGVLHDIGKIGVPEAILTKPGPLSEAEYGVMREHPTYGARLVSPLRFSPQVAPIILAHHEWWNGGGYPFGLRGQEIPIGARIIAVVDAFDAMTTDRCYRAALSVDEALERLFGGRGSQWDPELVDAFADLIHTGQIRTQLRVRMVNQSGNKLYG